MHICFLIKQKIENRQLYGQAHYSMYDYFDENYTHLVSNGMAAISKRFKLNLLQRNYKTS